MRAMAGDAPGPFTKSRFSVLPTSHNASPSIHCSSHRLFASRLSLPIVSSSIAVSTIQALYHFLLLRLCQRGNVT